MSNFAALTLGDEFVRELTVSEELMAAFRSWSGDDHPLHNDLQFAAAKGFPRRVAYGNLLGLMVSALVGVEMFPFEVMLASQSIIYRKPVLLGDTVTMRGVVDHKQDALRVAELKISVRNQQGTLVASGKVQVKGL